MNHYQWLDENLEDFWQKVFGKSLSETMCGGIVSAHGDKGRGYKDQWEAAGVPWFHGMAIYLLTYTKELGDTPKWESEQWVIDNYPKYKPLLNPVPREYELGCLMKKANIEAGDLDVPDEWMERRFSAAERICEDEKELLELIAFDERHNEKHGYPFMDKW